MYSDAEYLIAKGIKAADARKNDLFFNVSPVDWTNAAFTGENSGDPIDKAVFNILKKNFWDPDKHNVSEDIPNWKNHSPASRTALAHVVVGLTKLDTAQSLVGVPNIIPYAVTPHEPHVGNGIVYQESIHAQSYSRIFQTLLTVQEIAEANEWADNHRSLVAKLAIFERVYRSGDPALIRIASVFFESFMFWTSFFYFLYLDRSEELKLQASTTIIRLILRDEGIHGYYIGYKFQQQLKEYAKLADDPVKAEKELKSYYYDKAMELFMEIYPLEMEYTDDLYGDIGLADQVKQFLHYNANKAFQNLGYNTIIFGEEDASPDERVIALMNGDTNDDMFAGDLSTYKILPHGDTKDAAWDIILKK